jgi:hypothetical protein
VTKTGWGPRPWKRRTVTITIIERVNRAQVQQQQIQQLSSWWSSKGRRDARRPSTMRATTAATIAGIELGNRNPSRKALEQLASALHVHLAECLRNEHHFSPKRTVQMSPENELRKNSNCESPAMGSGKSSSSPGMASSSFVLPVMAHVSVR